MTSRQKATLWLLLTFVLGIALGAISIYALLEDESPHRHKERLEPAQIVEKMDEGANLELSPQQKEQIVSIMEESRKRIGALSDEYDSQKDALKEKVREEIKGVMSPEQREKWESHVREWKARKARR